MQLVQAAMLVRRDLEFLTINDKRAVLDAICIATCTLVNLGFLVPRVLHFVPGTPPR